MANIKECPLCVQGGRRITVESFSMETTLYINPDKPEDGIISAVVEGKNFFCDRRYECPYFKGGQQTVIYSVEEG